MKNKFLIILAASLLFLSCVNDIQSPDSENNITQDNPGIGTTDEPVKYGSIQGSFIMEGAIPSEIQNLSQNNNFRSDGTRTAMPSLSDGCKYYVIATASGQITKRYEVTVGQSNQNGDFTVNGNTYLLKNLASSKSGIIWTVEFGIKNGDAVIMSDSNPFKLTEEVPVYVHDFLLKPETGGTGEVDLEMTVPASVASVTATIGSTSWGPTITVETGETSKTVEIKSTSIATGAYNVTFSFFSSDGLLLYRDKQSINVLKGCKTNKWVKSETNNSNSIIDSGAYTLTQVLINNFERTTFYVGTTLFASPDDAHFGSAADPVKSLSRVVQLIKARNKSDATYTIYICGTVKGAQTLSSDLTGNAAAITLSGFANDSSDKLLIEQGSTGSVLKVDTTVPVTITNLTITGGNATGNDDAGNGGGIYIAKGTVKLTDGTIIAGNTATNGGGVYLAGSDSTLFMYGSALIGAQADSYPTKAEDASNSADNGGGIYNNGGSVYLGYSKYVSSSNKTESDITAGYGIRRNYAIFYSGIQSEGGTVLIRSGSISNNGTKYDEDWKGYGGALGVTAVGTYTISGGTFSSNYARNGGVVYIKEVAEEDKDNPIVVNISGGTFSNNTGVGGAVIRVQKYSKVVISGNPTFTGNNATASGGVIYNDYGIITMTGGTMGGTTNSDQNTCGAYGGAIYQSGTFNLSGSAKIYSGSPKKNDVYLSSGKKITIDANYTGSGNNDESKMSVTPNTWTRGLAILDGSKLTSTNKDYFSITDAEWSVVTTGDTTLTGHINAPLYVAGTSALTIDGASYGAGSGSGKGTKTSPYSSISAAVNQCWSYDLDFTINVVGTVSGAQTMPAADETNKTGLAKSITVNGIGDTTNPAKLKNTNATILKIQNTKPIILRGLEITGTVEGGGIIIMSPDADVTLDGVEIYNNQATAGGAGIYNYGMLKIADARIYNNRVTGDYYGGGLCNKGGTVYIYGNNTVIGKADANTTATYDPVNSINNYSNVSNYSKNNGGGIYNGYRGTTVNGVTTNIYGTVYIGKDPEGNRSKPKITYNYANKKGGGIYNESQCTIEFHGGDISYNSTIANQQLTAYQGGGIYSEGTFIIEETQTQKNIKGNASYQGGAIYMTGANSSLSMGGPSGASLTYISIPYSDTTTDVNYKNTIYLGEKTSGVPCTITITRYIARSDCSIMKIDTACSTYRGKLIVSKGGTIGDGDFSSSLNKLVIKQPSGNTGYDYYISSTGVLSQPVKYTSATKVNIQPGDILMKNGDVLPFDSRMSITKADAIGVVFYNGTGCSTNGSNRILVMGVKYRSIGLKSWTGKSNSYHPTSDPSSSLYATATASGDDYNISGTYAINGKDNSTYVSSFIDSGSAFNSCLNYKDIDTNLTGTYATDWYLPSLKELWIVRQNKTAVISSLNFLSTAYTQEGSSTDFQYYVSQGQKTYGYWCSNSSSNWDASEKEIHAWIVRLDDSTDKTSNTYLAERIQPSSHYNYEYVMPIHEVNY